MAGLISPTAGRCIRSAIKRRARRQTLPCSSESTQARRRSPLPSSNGIDFSRSEDFGFVGDAFVAQLGDQAPVVGKVLGPVGFKVVRVNVKTGVIRDFAVNFGKENGPASKLESGGLERPLSVRFDKAGRSLYVVDFGVMTMTEKGPEPKQGTGVLWRITRAGKAAG
jgi:hypothetical protein